MNDQKHRTGLDNNNQKEVMGASGEDARLELLLKMARKRREVSAPDVDAEWADFKLRHIVKEVQEESKSRPMRPWVAALLGAAAMWCVVMLYEWAMGTARWDSALSEPFVALRYEKAPRHVVLDDGEGRIDVSQADSLSFVEQARHTGGRVVTRSSREKEFADATEKVDSDSIMRKLSTPRGMGFKVILPDGSEVLLNAESTIEFPEAFHSGERRVVLHGEAFFKVARDEQHPFVVTADNMEVRVHGTEFNLRNYVEEGASCVSLISGSVEVSACGAKGEGVMIEPGEKAWCEGMDVKVAEEDTYVVTQWVHGLFYFDGAPLLEVLQELGRWYNYGVVFYNSEAMGYAMHFSASREGSIEDAIRHLNRLRKFHVKIEGHNIVVY